MNDGQREGRATPSASRWRLWARPGPSVDSADDEPTDPAFALDIERACEAIVAAQKDFSRALAACRSREARLRAIAKAAASNAAALRHGERIGLRLFEYETLNRDWKPPWELTWRAPRPGPTVPGKHSIVRCGRSRLCSMSQPSHSSLAPRPGML